MIEDRFAELDQKMAGLLRPFQDQVKRLAEIPGLGVDSAQQVFAEVGTLTAAFPSAMRQSSRFGACSGDNQSAGVNHGQVSSQFGRSCTTEFGTKNVAQP